MFTITNHFQNEIQQLLSTKYPAKLEEKIFSLEEKVMALENRLHIQELVLAKIARSDQKMTGKSQTPRTCQELYDESISLQSGYFTIDPDGDNIGDPAIYVYCNVSNGMMNLKNSNKSKYSKFPWFY